MPWSRAAAARRVPKVVRSNNSGTDRTTAVAAAMMASSADRWWPLLGAPHKSARHCPPSAPLAHVSPMSLPSPALMVRTKVGGRTSGSSTDPSLDATSTFRWSFGTNDCKKRFSSWRGTSTAAVRRKARKLSSTGVASGASPSPSGFSLDAAPGGSSHQAMPWAGLPMSMDRSRGTRWSGAPMRGSTRRPDSVRVTSTVTSAAAGRSMTGAALRPGCTKGSPRTLAWPSRSQSLRLLIVSSRTTSSE